jgi:nuclear pore complex protein Nup205
VRLAYLLSPPYLKADRLLSACAEFDGFIPPATERHHQLLLPALQLVVSTIVSFGSDTQVATRQAFAFVTGQRENLLVALKDCAAQQTVPLLREAQLIVTLLSVILPSISDEDLVSCCFGLCLPFDLT